MPQNQMLHVKPVRFDNLAGLTINWLYMISAFCMEESGQSIKTLPPFPFASSSASYFAPRNFKTK